MSLSVGYCDGLQWDWRRVIWVVTASVRSSGAVVIMGVLAGVGVITVGVLWCVLIGGYLSLSGWYWVVLQWRWN